MTLKLQMVPRIGGTVAGANGVTTSRANGIWTIGLQYTGLLVNFTGDFGTGGLRGFVPAPSAGDSAANKFLHANGTWQAVVGGIIRERLTAPRTYYVRPNGNDSNTGLVNTAGGAFLTLQKAYTIIRDTIDGNGQAVAILVADGTYSAGINAIGPLVGIPSLAIIGNTGTPANVVISVTGDHCFSATYLANLNVSGVKVTTATSGDGFFAGYGGIITVTSVNYGICASSHNEVAVRGQLIIAGNYTISGGAGAHMHVYSQAFGEITSGTVTLTGTPNFSNFFFGCSDANVSTVAVTFSGAATGQRYYVHKDGIIDVENNGVTYLPGNVAGIAESGGLYFGIESDTASSIAGAGTVIGDATQLTSASGQNVTTAAAGTGVKLPAGRAGMKISLFNSGLNTLNVYPQAGEFVAGNGTFGGPSVPITLPTMTGHLFHCTSTGFWCAV